MKLIFTLNIVLLSILTSMTSYGQRKMTKEEIFKTWKGFQQEQNWDSLFRFEIHGQTRETLDKLLRDGVDTLLVYSVSYPGSVELKKDPCSTRDPIMSYFFIQHQGNNYFKRVNGKCETAQFKTSDRLIKFMSSNYEKIKEEFFMNVIYGVEGQGDDLHISGSLIAHEPKYEILLQLGNRFKYLRFTESELTDKKNLFYDYNRSLTSFKNFELIKSKIEKI